MCFEKPTMRPTFWRTMAIPFKGGVIMFLFYIVTLLTTFAMTVWGFQKLQSRLPEF
ncbi:hypothetical protein LINPERHAP1_LOCUS22813 [Linum perenne]